MKPTLILVGADKGGVGKTMVARALADFMRTNSIAFHAFDTESGAPDGVLKRFVPDAKLIDIATVPGQMQIFDSIAAESVTLVDIRAGQLTSTLVALLNAGVMGDVRSGKVRLIVLHILGSTVASAREVAEIVNRMTGAEYTPVRNHASADATFAQIAGLPGVAGNYLDIPNLNEFACEAVDEADSSFVAFTINGPSRTLRGYVQTWYDLVVIEFNKLKLV